MNSKKDLKLLNSEAEIQIRRIVRVRNVEFDEEFLSELLSNYFSKKINDEFPRMSDALNIYLNESPAFGVRKFQLDAVKAFNNWRLQCIKPALQCAQHRPLSRLV